jgi:hypothetical protein
LFSTGSVVGPKYKLRVLQMKLRSLAHPDRWATSHTQVWQAPAVSLPSFSSFLLLFLRQSYNVVQAGLKPVTILLPQPSKWWISFT